MWTFKNYFKYRITIERKCQCELEVAGLHLICDLVVMDMFDFDIILGMEWLAVHWTVIDWRLTHLTGGVSNLRGIERSLWAWQIIRSDGIINLLGDLVEGNQIFGTRSVWAWDCSGPGQGRSSIRLEIANLSNWSSLFLWTGRLLSTIYSRLIRTGQADDSSNAKRGKIWLEWSIACERSFQELKRRLINVPNSSFRSETSVFAVHPGGTKMYQRLTTPLLVERNTKRCCSIHS